MKRLIALILLAPALASAGTLDCPPFTVCYGTLTIDDNGEGSLGGAYWRVRHGTRFGTHQIPAKVGFVVVRSHIAHQTAQIAEVIDTKNNIAGT